MQLNRSDLIYRNGMLAEQQRKRVSNVPLRYKRTLIVSRVIELTEAEIGQYAHHQVLLDDDGRKVMYTCTEHLAIGLSKSQALAMLG